MLRRLNRWWDQWRTTADEWSTRCLQHPFEPASSAKPLTLSGLEPRILFSATPIDLASLPGGDESAATVATIEIDEESTTSSESEITASTLAEQSPGEVIIIDAGVPDLQQLLDDLSRSGRDTDVFVLDGERDGVEQITEILDSRSEIDSLHLISHSENGGVRLGNLWLSETNLDGYAGQIATWQSSLSGDADILLYGCDLAADPSGRTLVDSISALTGADVAASSDDTGHAKYGGNWELEYRVGDIESAVVFSSDLQASWEHKLATLTVTTFADVMDNGDGMLSLREAIIQANAGGGGDTIVLSSGTYLLTIGGNSEDAAATGDLDINQDVTITGAGASTTIDASGIGDRVFHVRSGTTVISDLKITGGQEALGGAIKVETATLQLSDIEIFGNHATTNGGGIHSTGTLILERVTVAENTADTNAGGIYIANNSTATLTNVTVSGNDGNLGGGIFNANGDVTMINCTIANNSSGIATSGSHTTELKNTILDNIGANADQPLTSLGDNLDTDGTAFPGSPLEGADPLLGVLADNGGVGRTHAITTSSPAYNAGTLAGAPATDQRGISRDGSPDIGAFEVAASGTLVVDTTNDVVDGDTTSIANLVGDKGADGKISLREAIIATNNTAGADTISLAAGTYTLSLGSTFEDFAAGGDLDIRDNLTIIGANVDTTIIDGGSIDRVFDVRNGATFELLHITVTNGNAGSDAGGGMRVTSGSTAIATDVKFTGNQGSAINNEGTLTLIDSTFDGNTTTGWGGGIYNLGSITTDRVTFSNNTSAKDGGAIYNFGGSAVNITNTTFSGNSADRGGAIWTNQPITVTNSTFYDNTATGSGVGGIQLTGGGSATVRNTILAFNTGGNTSAAVISLGGNIDSGTTAGLTEPTDQSSTDPMLDPVLRDNGGPTLTHALLLGSTAINAGTTSGAPSVDQRGTTRDAAPDIGAYEFDSAIVLNSVQDTYISANDKTFNYGGSSVLVVDASSGNQGDIRTLLKFDFASIPVGATITGATLLLEATFIDSPLDVNVYELLESWTEGSGTGTVGVGNWDDREAGTAWTDAGGTIDPTIVSTFSASTTGQHSWDITTLVQAWVSGSKVNHGMLLGSEDGGSATVSYSSREGSTAPQLVIEYVANGTPTADAGGPYVINEGEAVSLVGGGSSDPDGDPLSFAWDLDNDGIFGEAGEPTTVSPTVTWATLQSFGIGDDGVHTIGLRVDDGRGGISDTTTTLTVNNVGPTGNADSGAGFTTDEDTAFTTANVLANDSDPNSSDVLSVSGIDLTGTVGLVIDNGDGTFDYDPNGQFESLGVGQQATDTFTYFVSDGDGGSSSAVVTITINGRNDAPTDITLDSNNVAENAAGAVIGNVAVVDADAGDTHTWSVDDVRFEIVGGQLKLKAGQSLDFETEPTVNLTITVTDQGGGGLSYNEAFVINVTGVNEAPTDITLDNNNVAENAAGAVIGNVAVVDPDAGDTHTWSVDDVRFEIVGGQLKLKAGQSLDFETEPTVNLTITVTDQGGGGLSYNEAFVVNVTGVNEAPTDITLDNNNVAENAAGAVIGNVAVVDPDAGDTHTWSVDDVRFEIVGGQLKLKAGQSLDFETEPTVNLTITVTDQGGGGLSYNEAFVVNVTDANEAPTDITLDSTNVSEQTDGAIVGNVGVVDPDAGDTHTWTVDDVRFEIVGGQLKLKAGQTLDKIAEPTVNVTITVTDQGGGGLAYNEAFVLTVDDVNQAPTDIDLDNNNVAENAAGAVIGNVTVVDPDVGDTHALTVDDVRFEIVGGQLRLKAGQSLDFETEPTVNITITATDQGGGGLSYNEAFVINVSNVNEAPVAIDDNHSGANEGALYNRGVPGVLSNDTDPDLDTLDAILVSGPSFATTFVLNVDGSYSYQHDGSETTTDTFTYRVWDGNLFSNVATVTLTIAPTNDAPTDITLDNTNVNENTAGAIIGNLGVVDPDIGDTHSWSVDDTRFEIVGTQLKLKAGQSLDSVAEPTVSLTITATDQGGTGLAYNELFVITVSNVNEAPTDITLSNANVNENSPGAVIGTLGVVDPDPVDVHIGSVNDTRFEIIGSTLKLKTGQSLDFEAGGTVNVTITVTDQGGTGLSYSEVFTITVNNVNEAPIADTESYAVFAGNTLTAAAPGVIAGDFDPDGDNLTAGLQSGPANGTLTFSADGSFTYTPDAGFVGTDSFIYQASDGSLSSAPTLVTITVAPAVIPLPPTPDGGDGDEPEPPPVPEDDPDPKVESDPPIVVDDGPINPGTGGQTPTTRSGTPVERAAVPAVESPEFDRWTADTDLGDERNAASFASVISSSLRGNGSATEELRSRLEDIFQISVFGSQWQSLDSFREELLSDDQFETLVVGAAVGAAVAASVGQAVWLLRAGYMASTLMSTMPIWRTIDPLPVLEYLEDDQRQPADKESLQSIIEQGKKSQDVPSLS